MEGGREKREGRGVRGRERKRKGLRKEEDHNTNQYLPTM